MKQLLSTSELIGKTISHISGGVFDTLLAIRFTDDSYCIILPSGDDEYLKIQPYKEELIPSNYKTSTLLDLGVISEEQKKAIDEKTHAEYIRRSEESELELLNRLKKKYNQ